MITIDQLADLLDQNVTITKEGSLVDYKTTVDLKGSSNHSIMLTKTVMAMANTPRDKPAYIVIGVREDKQTGELDPLGYNGHLDGAQLQDLFIQRVHPIPSFTYKELSYKGKKFGVISVLPERIGPCMALKGFKKKIKRSVVYVRRDSRNDEATPEDLTRIHQWLSGGLSRQPQSYEMPAWEVFMDSIDNFDPQRRYVLLTGGLDRKTVDCFSVLGHVPWVGVFDFDPDSDCSGLLQAVKPVLEVRRALHYTIIGDRMKWNPSRATKWFFARGLRGREDTLETGDWLSWCGKYGGEIKRQFEDLARGVSPAPVTCIVLSYDHDLTSHLESAMEGALGAFGESISFIVVTQEPLAEMRSLVAKYNARFVELPQNLLCSGLKVFLGQHEHACAGAGEECVFPGKVPTYIEPRDQRYLEEELELVHINVGKDSLDENVCHAFLRGAEISWPGLNMHCDVDREQTSLLKKQVETELENGHSARISLYHIPGAGGTTVAYRVLWDLHKQFPCVILNHSSLHTGERIFDLSGKVQKAVLVLIDGGEVLERQIDDLYNYLRSKQIPVVILQTLRRFKYQVSRQGRGGVQFLRDKLTGEEAHRFLVNHLQVNPSRKAELERLLNEPDYWTAFYFGLQAFGKDFLGIPAYVGARISHLGVEYKRILCFLSMAHLYAQQPIPGQAFAELLGVSKTRPVVLAGALPGEALDLLSETEDGAWRTAHVELAKEIIKQVLTAKGMDRRQWRDNLSSWAIDFADFCRGTDPHASREMLEIVRRTFIYRDNQELLGTEQSATQDFAHLIEDIQSPEGRLAVLRHLVELYPDEAHFAAHLGRFYAMVIKNYEKALEYNEQALALDDSNPVFHHMRGMTFRYQITDLMTNKGELQDIIGLAKSASDSFEKVREISRDNEHGYISEVQLIIKILDYAGRQHPEGVHGFLSTHIKDPYLQECFEKAEYLLHQVRQIRAGGDPDPYEQQCRAHLDLLYGNFHEALQKWNNLLSSKTLYAPPVRRQIVWTYLARSGREWGQIPYGNLGYIISLLEDNLREEPHNDKNLHLWVQAIRHHKHPPSLESVIEKVGYWKASSGTLDAVYHLYMFYVLEALQGSALACDEAKRYIEECRHIANMSFRRHRTTIFDWLGRGEGVESLIHRSQIGSKTDIELMENDYGLGSSPKSCVISPPWQASVS